MLSDHSLNELEHLLESQRGVTPALPLDALHGFVTALVITGEPPAMEDWLGWVLDPRSRDIAPSAGGGADDPVARRLSELVGQLIQFVDAALDDPEHYFEPVVRAYTSAGQVFSDGGVWCAGFLRGMEYARAQWERFLDQPEAAELLWSIHELAEDDGHPALVPDEGTFGTRVRGERDLERRDALTGQLPHAIEAIVQRITELALDDTLEFIDRDTAQDPECPCGSGKRFRRCCGGERVLH